MRKLFTFTFTFTFILTPPTPPPPHVQTHSSDHHPVCDMHPFRSVMMTQPYVPLPTAARRAHTVHMRYQHHTSSAMAMVCAPAAVLSLLLYDPKN